MNVFNTTFYEAFSQDHQDEIKNQLESGRNENPSNFPLMPDFDITWQEVKKLIEGLDLSRSPGPDDICPNLLKLIPRITAYFLKVICKNSLRTFENPKDLNAASIIPLNKKGLRSIPSNNKPVSLTSAPCKLLEHIIKSALYSHIEMYNLITDRQHGFLTTYSCTTKLLTLVYSLCQTINSRG